MSHLILLPEFQAAVRPTEIIEPHREPTHPAVIPLRLGKGQRVSYFAPVAQAAGTVVAVHHARVDLRVAQQREHMLKTRFAMHRSDLDPLHPTAFVAFLNLTIGQALPPTDYRTAPSALGG